MLFDVHSAIRRQRPRNTVALLRRSLETTIRLGMRDKMISFKCSFHLFISLLSTTFATAFRKFHSAFVLSVDDIEQKIYCSSWGVPEDLPPLAPSTWGSGPSMREFDQRQIRLSSCRCLPLPPKPCSEETRLSGVPSFFTEGRGGDECRNNWRVAL
jgi:hypothetical protein